MAHVLNFVFPLSDGPCILQCPTKISPEEFAVLGNWIALALRSIGRSTQQPDNPPPPKPEDVE